MCASTQTGVGMGKLSGGLVAFLGAPGIGGPYRTGRALREGLRAHRLTVRWLSQGADAKAVIERPEWTDERSFGSVLAPHSRDEREQAIALLDHLEGEGYDAIIVNVLADRVQSSVVRHLHPRIRRIMIVHSITPGTYAAAQSIADYVHATVGVSPRIRNDLLQRSGFPPAHTHVIANAFDGDSFTRQARAPSSGPLRLLSLGRLEDASKGIFWLPKILRELRDLPVTLTIAGDGPDGDRLRRLFLDQSDRVRFMGAVPLAEVAGVMAAHDVFLLPSRYEGQSIALVEALATGCVPIASFIRGVTDFVVERDETGFLFPVGDTQSAARLVRRMDADRFLLARMSAAGRLSAVRRFQLESMAAAYAAAIEGAMSRPREIATPLPRDEWSLPPGLRPSFRSLLPAGVKNGVRLVMERWAS
jgi:glycosyltransferase involved in cell wall biosynthesis